jgi:hypothetical protein
MPSKKLIHYYRQARRHQLETYSAERGTGGGAYPGCHAEAAINSARGQIHLRKTLGNRRK